MRKARLTSVSACTVPVSETVSPPLRGSTVTTRTGRISGAGGGASSSQAPSSSSDAEAGWPGADMVRNAACSEAVRWTHGVSDAAAAEYPKQPANKMHFAASRENTSRR